MIPIPPTVYAIAASAFLSGIVGVWGGYTLSAKHFEPKVEKLTVEVTMLRTTIRIADEQAQIQQVKYKEALHETNKVAVDLAGRISAGADIDAARVRELKARGTALATIIAASPDRDIPNTCESTIAGRLAEQEIKFIELKGRCITDAAARVVIKDWAERIGLKPAQ
jgi:hypothetical protein